VVEAGEFDRSRSRLWPKVPCSRNAESTTIDLLVRGSSSRIIRRRFMARAGAAPSSGDRPGAVALCPAGARTYDAAPGADTRRLAVRVAGRTSSSRCRARTTRSTAAGALTAETLNGADAATAIGAPATSPARAAHELIGTLAGRPGVDDTHPDRGLLRDCRRAHAHFPTAGRCSRRICTRVPRHSGPGRGSAGADDLIVYSTLHRRGSAQRISPASTGIVRADAAEPRTAAVAWLPVRTRTAGPRRGTLLRGRTWARDGRGDVDTSRGRWSSTRRRGRPGRFYPLSMASPHIGGQSGLPARAVTTIRTGGPAEDVRARRLLKWSSSCCGPAAADEQLEVGVVGPGRTSWWRTRASATVRTWDES